MPEGKGSARWACGFLCVSESVCVCLNLSVCVCALEPPPQRSQDASSGGGYPVCPFPLLPAAPSQELLSWFLSRIVLGVLGTLGMRQTLKNPIWKYVVDLPWFHQFLSTLGKIKALRPGTDLSRHLSTSLCAAGP